MVIYARNAKSALNVIATIGRPFFVAKEKILGAFPDEARLWRARDDE